MRNTPPSYILRSTKDFKLELGLTEASLTVKTIEGRLARVYTISDCNSIPEEEFEVDEEIRFAKFSPLSYYGTSAGLQYISFEE